MSISLSSTSATAPGRDETAPRGVAMPLAVPTEDGARPTERAPAPVRAAAPVASASVTMNFEVGSAQSGLVLRLTDSVSGQLVREIQLESESSPDRAKGVLQGQIVDLRA